MSNYELAMLLSKTGNAYYELTMRALAVADSATARYDFERSQKARNLARYYQGQQTAICNLIVGLTK